ncbi:MAG: cysteine-rich CWC family protein [Putridiphycobacter sp.]
MKKKCERCHEIFECRRDNITQCHCYTVQLSNPQLKMLNEKYKNCLCPSCLKLFAKGS